MTEPKALKEEEQEKKSWLTALRHWYWDVSRNTWFERHIEFPITDFKIGVRNLIKWFRIVWKDRDYGYDGLLRMMQFKIEKLVAKILKNDIIVDEDQQRIKRYAVLCCKLIDRYLDETYEMEYLDYHKSDFVWHDYSSEDFPKEKGLKRLEIVDREDRLDTYFKKYPNDYRKTLAEIKKNYPDRDPFHKDNRTFIAIIMGGLRQNKANGLIWKILDKELRFWWD